MQSHSEECDVTLEKWMVRKYPEGVKFRDRLGMTSLAKVCRPISCTVDEESAAPDPSSICRFLLQEYPKAVFVIAGGGRGLPLHYLARR